MKLTGDFHTHTMYSDGLASIEENINAAIDQGLKMIAITDHGPETLWGLSPGEFKLMVKECERLKKKYASDIRVLLGIEANIINAEGDLDVTEDMVAHCDLLIAGYHFDIVDADVVASASRIKRHRKNKMDYDLHPSFYEEVRQTNTLGMINAMEQYNLDFIVHPGYRYPIDLGKVALAAAITGTALEINESYGILSPENLKDVKDIPDLTFVINTDSHTPATIGKVPESLKAVKEAGISADQIINVTE
jgi:putative hydrolase